jgi:hypothetical protein
MGATRELIQPIICALKADVFGVVDYGARSPEQGSRAGSQRDQVTRGGARQPSGWLRTWQWTEINVSRFVLSVGNELCKSLLVV